MIVGVAAAYVVARARDRAVILVYRAVTPPRLHQQLVRVLGKIRPRRSEIVIAHAQVHQKIHRSPDAPPPVVLILATRHVACYRWHHPLAVELARVDIMLAYHSRGLLRRGHLRDERIEIGRRKPRRSLAGISTSIQVDARRLIP